MVNDTPQGFARCRMLSVEHGKVGQCPKTATHVVNGLRLCQMCAEAVLGTVPEVYSVTQSFEPLEEEEQWETS